MKEEQTILQEQNDNIDTKINNLIEKFDKQI